MHESLGSLVKSDLNPLLGGSLKGLPPSLQPPAFLPSEAFHKYPSGASASGTALTSLQIPGGVPCLVSPVSPCRIFIH